MREKVLIEDEFAMLEPQNDILATALLVMGFVIFAAVISRTYVAYDEHTSILENYEQASLIAGNIAADEMLHGTRSDIISAEKLDALCCKDPIDRENKLLFSKFTGNFDFWIEVSTDDGKHKWMISREEKKSLQRNVIAASVPVVIEIGAAKTVPGTLTVKLHRNNWF